MTTKPTGLDLLREPFPPHQISKLPKPYKKDSPKGNCQECGGYHGLPAAHLDYVGHAALTDRLLDADPEWRWDPMATDEIGLPAFDRSGGLWIKLTVCGVTRLGYGHAKPKDYGEPGVREKEVIGDAIRNAAMRFGAALDLWHKGDLHADEGDEANRDGADTAGEREMSGTIPETPAPEPARWQEPGSIYSGIHKLKAGLRQHDRDLDGCGDSEMVYALCGTDEWREFCRVAELHAPWYLRGGEPAPPEFEGLLAKAERMVREFDGATANHMTDMARA